MAPVTTASERRREQRKRPLSLIYVELSPANGGMMRDLSDMGFAVRAMMPLRAGETASFAFSLDASTRLEGQCKVLWVKDDGRVAGLQFTAITPEMRKHVRAWLGNLDQSLKTPPATASEAPRYSTMQQLRDELRTVPARSEFPEREIAATSDAPTEVPVAAKLRSEVPPEVLVEAATVEPAHSPSVLHQLAESEPESVTEVRVPREPFRAPVPAPAPPEISAAPPRTTPLTSAPMQEPLPTLPDVQLPYELFRSRAPADRSVVSIGARIMLFFVLLAVAVVFHRQVGNAIVWLGLKIGGTSSQDTPSISKVDIPPPAPPAASTASSSADQHTDPSSAVTTSKNKTEGAGPHGDTFSLPAKSPPPAVLSSNRSGTAPATAGPVSDTGQLEFQAAEDILKKNIGSDLSEAVRLLWASVEKGNSNAEVALAGLYIEGKGVSKNCDQAKILLTAAARKGGARTQDLLSRFQGESCE